MLVQSEAVFPTQQDYDIGARVSWEWDTSQVVGPCFYKTSDGATVKAFDRAAYFVGQLLTT